MSTYTVELLEEDRMILVRFEANYDTQQQGPALQKQIHLYLADAEKPLWLVNDMSKLPPITLERLIASIQRASQGDQAILGHQKLRGFGTITSDPVYKLGTEMIGKGDIGGHTIFVTTTLDDMLTLIRAENAATG